MSLSPVLAGGLTSSTQTNPTASFLPVPKSTGSYTFLTSSILKKIMYLLPLSLADCVLVNKHWKISIDKARNDYIKSIAKQDPHNIFGPEEWQKTFKLTNPPFAPPVPLKYITDLYNNNLFTRYIMLIPDKIELNNVQVELTPDVLKKIGFIFDLEISNPWDVQGIQKKRGQNIYPLSFATTSRPNGAYWVAYKVASMDPTKTYWVSNTKDQGYKPHIWDVVNIAFQRRIVGLPLVAQTGSYILKPMKNGNPNIEFGADYDTSNVFRNFTNTVSDYFHDDYDDNNVTPNYLPNYPLITRRSKPIATPLLASISSPASNSASSVVSNTGSNSKSNKQIKSFSTSNFFMTILKIGDFIPGVSIATNIYTLFRKRAYKKAAADHNLNIKKTRNYAYFKNKSATRCFLLMIPGLNIIVAIHHLCKKHKKPHAS